jgi:hypothetical protein
MVFLSQINYANYWKGILKILITLLDLYMPSQYHTAQSRPTHKTFTAVTKIDPHKRMKRLRLAVKFGTRKRAEGLKKIVRNNICDVTGSRSSRNEKSRKI